MILKKNIIVFIPYNFRRKQTNVFLPTLLSFFLNLYFTNHCLHSVILLLSCRKLKLIIVETKLLIPHPSRFFSNASSSLLIKGRAPLVSLLLPVYPRKQGRNSVPNCPQTQTKSSKQNLLSSLAKGSEKGWLHHRKLLAILTPIQPNRKTASLLHPHPPPSVTSVGNSGSWFSNSVPPAQPGKQEVGSVN